MSLRRLTITIFTALAFVALAAYLAIDVTVDYVVQRKLASVSAKLGHQVTVARAHVDLPSSVWLEGVRVGDSDQPLFTIEQVHVTLIDGALWQQRIAPQQVTIKRPTFHIYSDGTWRGLYDVLKALMPSTSESTPSATTTSTARKLPALEVRGGRLIDHGGLIQLFDGTLAIEDGAISSSAHFVQPNLGRCTIRGQLDKVRLACDTAYTHPVPGGFGIELKEIEVTRKPAPGIWVPGVKLRRAQASKGNIFDALVSGLAADLKIDLRKNESGRWPIMLELVLPGGGKVLGRGDAGLDGMDFSAAVSNLEFGHTQSTVGGRLSGQYTVSVDRDKKYGKVSGRGKLNGFHVTHPALAEGVIGPMDLALKGQLDLTIMDLSKKWANVTMTEGQFTLGTIPFDFSGEFETNDGQFRIDARCDTPMVDGKALAEAIPDGLLPNLQPFKATGKVGFHGFLKLDTKDIRATKFKLRVPKQRFKLVTENKQIDFDALRTSFQTDFKVPGEEPDEVFDLTRTTGPLSERWTPLDEVPPLLPIAIMAQEDRGFYKHGGISMFHLRGSLVDNLEKGRFFRGGSTITMQLARNLFLHRKKTLARKLEEIILAWLLEQNFDKDEMMAFYVNVVEFGPDLYGIGEAATHYFDKRPDELSPAEIAWIVRLLPSPRPLYEHYRKGRLSRGHTRSINALLKLLVKRGQLDDTDEARIDRDSLWPDGTRDRPKKVLGEAL